MAKKKVVTEVVEEFADMNDPSVMEYYFDLTASELRVDSSDVAAIKSLVEAHNFKDAGRVFVGDKELVVLLRG